ncbi:MAG: 2Fe-2S iron-sulfur cluster-binding protein, partial [Gammaproteobacteria bacterium]|nr:2Fe-2S iron-sulfur cluster-binding protein [Gammaproteobacteria bacterium]
MRFSIYRYDPEKDDKPYMQDFTLDDVGPETMVLEALTRIKAMDESLSFRRSCGEGVCGSDGMNINGTNKLACVTLCSSLSQPITIRPLPGMPVIRDLVVDL